MKAVDSENDGCCCMLLLWLLFVINVFCCFLSWVRSFHLEAVAPLHLILFPPHHYYFSFFFFLLSPSSLLLFFFLLLLTIIRFLNIPNQIPICLVKLSIHHNFIEIPLGTPIL